MSQTQLDLVGTSWVFSVASLTNSWTLPVTTSVMLLTVSVDVDGQQDDLGAILEGVNLTSIKDDLQSGKLADAGSGRRSVDPLLLDGTKEGNTDVVDEVQSQDELDEDDETDQVLTASILSRSTFRWCRDGRFDGIITFIYTPSSLPVRRFIECTTLTSYGDVAGTGACGRSRVAVERSSGGRSRERGASA
eukprot:1196272-Prorocentrum_minimum.AAC.5